MKSKGIETPRKDKGRRKAAHGADLVISVLLPAGCCSPAANQAKEKLNHNFSTSASVFFLSFYALPPFLYCSPKYLVLYKVFLIQNRFY